MSSAQTDLRLPESIDAERALLGSLMLEASLWNQANYLSPDDFLIPSHKLVYQAMSEMRDAGLVFNPVLLTDKLKSTGDYDRVGGHSFIASLWDGLPAFSKISDITAYAYTVREKSLRRQLVRIAAHCGNELQDGETSTGEVITRLEEQLRELRSAHIQKTLPRLADGIDTYLDEMIASKLERSLVTFGAGQLDQKINGPNPGDLIIVGARTSVGKTVLALQAAVQTAQSMHGDHDPVVAFFSLEMSVDQIKNRALQMACGFPVNKFVIKQYGSEKISEIRQAARSLRNLQIFTDESKRLTANSILAQCQEIKKQTGYLDLVVIDYFQLLQTATKRSNQAAELGDISRDLKISAMELACPFIVPAQLNRENVKDARKPRLDDLRGSGSIEQDADVVILLHRPEGEDQDQDQERRSVIVAKQRNGWVGEIEGSFDKCQLFIFTPEEINGY